MAGLWRDPSAFRPAPADVDPVRPSARQSLALLLALLAVAGTVVGVSFLVHPDRARSFSLFHGSIFLNDSLAPVAVDLATGRPTVRLINAATQVGAKDSGQLTVTPLSSGTLLLNRVSGEFNVVASTGFVVKTAGGVPIAARPGAAGVTAIAAGDLAYLVQTGPTGTSVYLVGQTTVETATDAAARVRPRAFRAMTAPVSAAPGAAAAADGDLWMLAGDGPVRTVRRLALPPRSSAGATLTSTDHGTVRGAAALEAATAPDGSAVAGVASSGSIRLFGGSRATTVRYRTPGGLQDVLPTSNAEGRLSWLLHAADGWYGLSVRTDGSGLVGPTRLEGVDAAASLTTPASSLGDLYTMDAASGRLYRITGGLQVRTIDGATSYPVVTQGGRRVEAAGFSDPTVLARGPRVIFNDPDHLDALAVFTDGSHTPVTIEKSAAVAVNAADSAEALTRSRNQTRTAGRAPAPTQKARQANPVNNQVNNQVNCKVTQIKPHVPQITGATPGSRSVLLSWTYPLLDPQDCVPSTYVVSVRLASPGAPSPPGSVTVQGQQSVNLAGLFPSTRYSITVTAYINGQGTSSAPQLITTGAAGPAAPSNVSASTDANGTWSITWDSCGSVQDGCVPAASWRVVPEFCDGQGLSATPSPITVTADPTSVAQPGAQLQGGSALLGRGLRFQVEGIGQEGEIGDPSGFSACTYSWSPPVVSALSLQASTAATQVQLGSTTSATVTLSLGPDPVRAAGGTGAQFTYALTSGGSVVRTIGPTTSTTVTFDGIAPGQRYTATATVAPPRHPEAAVTVSADVLPATAQWPQVGLRVNTPVNQGAAAATLTLDITGISSAASRGETFDLVNSSLSCGNSSRALDATGFDPAAPLTFTVDRTQYYNSCKVEVQLEQNRDSQTDPPLFGAGPSNVASDTVSIDPASLTSIGGGDFSASWDGSSGGQSQIAVKYSGGDPLFALASGFSVAVAAPDGTACGGYSSDPSLHDVSVPQSCIDTFGASGDRWTVAVSFTFLGSTKGPYTVTGVTGGAAPTYTPPVCDVGAAGLTASWSGTATAPTVDVGVTDGSRVHDCSGWTYTIVGPSTPTCGSGDAGTAPPVTGLAVTCSDTPASTGWSVSVGYKDLSGSAHTATVPVTGSPPS